MVLPIGIPLRSTHFFPVFEENILSELYYTKPIVYVMIFLLVHFVVFGLINCIVLTFSYFEDNKYMLLLVPFIFLNMF